MTGRNRKKRRACPLGSLSYLVKAMYYNTSPVRGLNLSLSLSMYYNNIDVVVVVIIRSKRVSWGGVRVGL